MPCPRRGLVRTLLLFLPTFLPPKLPVEKRTEKKPKNVATATFDTPGGPFGKTGFFNRCGIEELGSQKVFYFGLVRGDAELLSAYSCIVPASYFVDVKASWLDYMGKVGELPDGDVNFDWRPPVSRLSEPLFSNIAQVARTGMLAEFRFYSFSMGYVWDRRKSSSEKEEKIVPQCQALFVSDLGLHLAIIAKLFDSK